MSRSVFQEIGASVASAYATARAEMSNDEAMASVMEEFDITNKRSLRSFLSSAKAGKVYQADKARAVGGASPVRKVAIVKDIAKASGIDFATLESLEKANKGTLEALLTHFSK